MMFGLGLLKLYSYGFNLVTQRRSSTIDELDDVFAAARDAGDGR